MAYTTKAIMRVESPFKDSTNIDDTYVDRAIAEADAIINSYLAGVYSLPLSETPTLIQDIATRLAINSLIREQNLNIEVASGVDWTTQLEVDMDTLRAIQNREMKLLDSSNVEFTLNTYQTPGGYPTQASTDDDDPDVNTSAYLTMNRKF